MRRVETFLNIDLKYGNRPTRNQFVRLIWEFSSQATVQSKLVIVEENLEICEHLWNSFHLNIVV